MIIEVFVKTSRRISDISLEDGRYIVSLKSKPHNNKANLELIDILSSHFDTPKSCVKILQGKRSRKKLIELS